MYKNTIFKQLVQSKLVLKQMQKEMGKKQVPKKNPQQVYSSNSSFCTIQPVDYSIKDFMSIEHFSKLGKELLKGCPSGYSAAQKSSFQAISDMVTTPFYPFSDGILPDQSSQILQKRMSSDGNLLPQQPQKKPRLAHTKELMSFDNYQNLISKQDSRKIMEILFNKFQETRRKTLINNLLQLLKENFKLTLENQSGLYLFLQVEIDSTVAIGQFSLKIDPNQEHIEILRSMYFEQLSNKYQKFLVHKRNTGSSPPSLIEVVKSWKQFCIRLTSS